MRILTLAETCFMERPFFCTVVSQTALCTCLDLQSVPTHCFRMSKKKTLVFTPIFMQIQWCLALRSLRLTTKPHYDEHFAIAFAIALQCFLWGNFTLRWSVPCFRNQFFAKRWFSDSWLVVSKWPPGKQNGPPLFSGMDSSLHRQRKWLRYGGSSLDCEFQAPRNALIGF